MGIRFKGNAIVIPGEHLNVDTAMEWYLGMDGLPPEEIASKFMWKVDPSIPEIAKKDDILACGIDFGYGKVHASFFIAMKYIGIKCIVAESLSSQMMKWGLMNGLCLVECPDILQFVKAGDEIEVDIETSVVTNHTNDQSIVGRKSPQYLIDVMNAGGPIGYLAKSMN